MTDSDHTSTDLVKAGSNPDTSLLIEIVGVLSRVAPQDRLRIVRAALTFLGSPSDGSPLAELPSTSPNHQVVSNSPDVPLAEFPRRVSIWMSQNFLGATDLEGVFHMGSGGVEIIAHSVPGNSNRERVRSCYLLAGLKSFLASGEPRFTDDTARAICRDLGCYDKANHSTYVKSLGNLIIGSKSSTYELTQPGLKAAAELIKEIRGI